MDSIRSILCYFNVDRDDHVALELADWMAREHNSLLTTIDVQRELSWQARLAAGFDQEVVTELIDHRMTMLRKQVAKLCADSSRVEVTVSRGKPWIEIIREVLRHQNDLVVKTGEADRGRLASPFGSTAAHLVRKCPCPVWLVNPKAQLRSNRVLAAISPNPESNSSIRFNRYLVEIAHRVAEQQGAELRLLHVWDEKGHSVPRLGMSDGPLVQALKGIEELVRKNLVDFLEESGLPGLTDNLRLVRGEPVSAISEYAKDHAVDLIVIGSMGRVGAKGLLIGNVAEAVLHQAPCSLLTIKPEGFVTPLALDDGAV